MPTVERNKFIRGPREQGRKNYEGNQEVYEMPEDMKPSRRFLPQLHVKAVTLGLLIVVFLAAITVTIIGLYDKSGDIL